MRNKKEIKIAIYNPRCTPLEVLSGNGDEILDNICIKADTEETLLSGEYYLDAVFLVDKEGLHKNIVNEAILKVKLDYGYEVFRIASIQANTRDMTVFARQITISESLDMWLEDVRPTNTNGQGALTWILDNSKGKKDIRLFSDISETSTAYYMNMNVYEALHTTEQAFQNRWGGEVRRRGYDLYINQKFGDYKGVQIRSRKNLTGFEVNSNIDSVVTRIKPVGFDGITIDGYVDSPLINNYHSIKTKEIKYENVKVKTEQYPDEGFDTLEQAQQELKRLAKLEYDENHIDVIKAEYTVNFIQLEYTEEYKNYALIERIYLGDEVDVYEENLDINITVRAIKKNFDVLAQRTTEIILSNDAKLQTPPSVGEILNKVDKLETSDSLLQSAIDNATNLITNGLSNSYVIVRKNEILVMDTPDINTATNVWRFNNGGLAHSKTGYNGQYSTAITQDGSIVATMITSGILNADLIRTGTIQNVSGTLQIDLNSNDGIMTRQNGKNAIELAGTNLKFYDWDGQGGDIGRIASTRFKGDADKPAIALVNNQDSYSTITYDGGKSLVSYMRFDKNRIVNDSYVPITIFEDVENRGILWFAHGENSMYNTNTNHLQTLVSNGYIIGNRATNKTMFRVEKDYSFFYNSNGNGDYARFSPTGSYFSNGNGTIIARFNPQEVRFVNSDTASVYTMFTPTETYFRNTNTGNRYATFNHNEMRLGDSANNTYGLVGVNDFWLQVDGGRGLFSTNTGEIQSDRNFVVNGNFRVTGNKNCIQETESFGSVAYYSVEDCESYLTDRTLILQKVEETPHGTFEKKILLDKVYKESVNLDLGYSIEILKESWGDYRIKEKTKDYFIVESDRKNFEFLYVVTAKRRGFEDIRNEQLTIDTETYANKNIALEMCEDNVSVLVEKDGFIKDKAYKVQEPCGAKI